MNIETLSALNGFRKRRLEFWQRRRKRRLAKRILLAFVAFAMFVARLWRRG